MLIAYKKSCTIQKVVAHSVQDAALADGEGCLSVDRVVEGYVVRHSRVTVDYFDKNGEKHRMKLKGYNSIVVQHEIDHTNGIMFYDRIDEKNPFAIQKRYANYRIKQKAHCSFAEMIMSIFCG